MTDIIGGIKEYLREQVPEYFEKHCWYTGHHDNGSQSIQLMDLEDGTMRYEIGINGLGFLCVVINGYIRSNTDPFINKMWTSNRLDIDLTDPTSLEQLIGFIRKYG